MAKYRAAFDVYSQMWADVEADSLEEAVEKAKKGDCEFDHGPINRENIELGYVKNAEDDNEAWCYNWE